MKRTPFGRMKFADITEAGDRFHYSTKTTKSYREQFGYWNYYAPYGSSFLVVSKQGVLDTRSSTGPVILDSTRGAVPVPEELLRAGGADVTSLVSPHRNLHVYWVASSEHPNTRIRYPQVFELQLETIPAHLMSAMRYYIDLQSKRSNIPPSRWPEIKPLDAEAEEIMNTRITPILDQIRESQLQAMERAMREFISLAFGNQKG